MEITEEQNYEGIDPDLRCTAKSKQSQKRCGRMASKGQKVCVIHGAKSRRGMGHHKYTHGKYSQAMFLPEDLSEQVTRMMNDPALIQLREEIAVTKARIGQLYSRLNRGEPENAWDRIGDIVAEMKHSFLSLNSRDAEVQAEAMDDLSNLITQTERFVNQEFRDTANWESILKLHDHLRKLDEAESKRLKDAQTTMTMEQIQIFVQFILSTIRKHVTDRRALQGISEDLMIHGGVQIASADKPMHYQTRATYREGAPDAIEAEVA